MARSNSPQALSVVSVTREGSVELTANEIVKFDGLSVGFTHARTWASMAAALTGKFAADSILKQLAGVHPRVARSIAGLCDLGQSNPLETFKFSDHPEAGLKEVEGLRLGPDITIVAKASCWHVRNGKPVIPLLQPRATDLEIRKLGLYAALGRRAFCRADWKDAEIEIIDLAVSDGAKNVEARVFGRSDLPDIQEDDLNTFLNVYVEGRKLAAAIRDARGPRPPKKPKLDVPMLPGFED